MPQMQIGRGRIEPGLNPQDLAFALPQQDALAQILLADELRKAFFNISSCSLTDLGTSCNCNQRTRLHSDLPLQLDTPLTYLKGVGPARAALLAARVSRPSKTSSTTSLSATKTAATSALSPNSLPANSPPSSPK